jgi:hypothetical protein
MGNTIVRPECMKSLKISKWVMRYCQSNDRLINGKTKNDKMTNSEMLNTTEKKIKIEPLIERSHEMIIVQNQVLIYTSYINLTK